MHGILNMRLISLIKSIQLRIKTSISIKPFSTIFKLPEQKFIQELIVQFGNLSVIIHQLPHQIVQLVLAYKSIILTPVMLLLTRLFITTNSYGRINGMQILVTYQGSIQFGENSVDMFQFQKMTVKQSRKWFWRNFHLPRNIKPGDCLLITKVKFGKVFGMLQLDFIHQVRIKNGDNFVLLLSINILKVSQNV